METKESLQNLNDLFCFIMYLIEWIRYFGVNIMNEPEAEENVIQGFGPVQKRGQFQQLHRFGQIQSLRTR